jgi:glyoxylase-like metal-dependent hydrolase (beta-lactamase superfamily II)
VGHASWLLQTAGLNILIDPVWARRVSPVSFFGPVRVNDPGVAFDALPPIDVVLVSHCHYDHLDVETLARPGAQSSTRAVISAARQRHDHARPRSGDPRRGVRLARPRRARPQTAVTWCRPTTGRRAASPTATRRCGPRS